MDTLTPPEAAADQSRTKPRKINQTLVTRLEELLAAARDGRIGRMSYVAYGPTLDPFYGHVGCQSQLLAYSMLCHQRMAMSVMAREEGDATRTMDRQS